MLDDNPSLVAQVEAIEAWLPRLCEPGQIIELRALGYRPRQGMKPLVKSGFYDYEHIGWLAREAAAASMHAAGTYFTINPVTADLLARRANRCDVAGSNELACDGHVLRRRWLLVDADANRISGVSANDAEKAAAIQVILTVRDGLRELGWPEPVLADSGNGGHLLYRIDLPTDDGGLVKRVLAAIGQQFGTEAVKIDLSVFNPSRISKLYGTWARKGDTTKDRPHRISKIFEIPDTLTPVSREQLETLAAQVKAPEPRVNGYSHSSTNGNGKHHANGDATEYSRLKVAEWLAARGIAHRIKEGPDNLGRTVYVLDVCPFDPAHGHDACVMQEPEGKLSAKCFHDGCAGHGWKEFKARIGNPAPEHYDPPLNPTRRPRKRQVGKAAEQVAAAGVASQAAEQPTDDEALTEDKFTDLGNAVRFVERHGKDSRYCYPWKKWLTWRNECWRGDTVGAVESMAKDVARSLFTELGEDEAPTDEAIEHAKRSQDARRITAMITLARSDLAILPDALDRDPWLFNCQNGTLDLRTGKLRDHCRGDLITKLCPVAYDPDAECETWERFLEQIFKNDSDLIIFIRRLLGYCLTGDVSEQVLPIFYGVGANGKSVFLNAVAEMLGSDYSMKAPPDLLMVKYGETHPTERADLFGKRFVAAVETAEGARLNETLVKELTGGDKIRARRMREDYWEFSPTHKIVLCTNHRPVVRGTDHAIWRRPKLVPFAVVIPDAEQDKKLGDKLRAELPGMLAWAVRGCSEWLRDGLGIPDAVRIATAEYRSSQDLLATFLSERCIVGPDYRCKASSIYEVFKQFCDESGEKVISQRRFGEALTEREIERYVSNGTWYRGVQLAEGWNLGT